MKSIVTKLVIYKKDPRFDYCPTPYYCEGHFVGGGQFCSYCGITDTQAQEKEIENTFIGDIFYVIDTRERNDFSSPCRVCNDEKKLTVNGITFDCPVCGGYRPRETVVSVQHFTVATVKVYVIKQEVSTDYWTIQNYRDLHFRVFRKRGHGYNGDGNNFTRDFTSNDIKNNLNVLPDEKFLQIYSQDGYFARNCERFIFDDYKLACRAAEILNESELARLNKYNAEHGTSFAPIWDKTNDPKN